MTLAIVLFFVGLAFVIAEVFITSLGLFAIIASGCLIASIAFAFRESQTAGLILLGGAVVAVPTVLVMGFKILPKTAIGRLLILDASRVEQAKGVSVSGGNEHLAGKQGIALSTLRPAGVAEIEGSRIDVVTEGEMIPLGVRVRVIHVEGNRIVVEEVRASSNAPRSA